MSDATAAGTIYDLGYQHYDGERLGRFNAIRTLVGYSFRSAFGIGRGERAKLVPIVLGLLCFAPVIVQVGMANADADPSRINFAEQAQFTNLFLVLLAAAQAPELLVVDRQLGVVSLYLSRSLRATDYAFAKLVALIGALLFYTLLPQLILFIGSLFVSGQPWQAFSQHWHTLGPIAGVSVAISCYMAAIALALSSLAARKGYASASVIAFFLMLPVLAAIVMSLLPAHSMRYATLGNPIEVLNGFARWAFGIKARVSRFRQAGPSFGVENLYTLLGTIAAAAALLTYRFRKSDI